MAIPTNNSSTVNSLGIVLMSKTLGYSKVKTRLRKDGHPNLGCDFFNLSLAAVEETLRSFKELSVVPVELYLSTAEKEAVGAEEKYPFHQFWQGPGDFSTKIARSFKTVKARHQHALIIGMDSPQLCVELLNQAAISLMENDYVFGPSLDGGFYLFGSRKNLPSVSWENTTWSVASTLAEFKSNLSLENSVDSLRAMCDVDTFEDLSILADDLRAASYLTVSQSQLLFWLETLHHTKDLDA